MNADITSDHYFRSGSRQPAGGRVHQWPTSTKPHQAQDHRDGGRRGQALRHLQAAQGLTRVRQQDP